MRMTLVVVFVGLAAGCADRTPARIASHRGDTVVVNSRRPTPLPARVFNAGGRELSSAVVSWRYVQGDRFTVDDSGRVTCDRRGEVRVLATSGAAQREVTVLCRPIATVRLGTSLVLRPGEESDAYDLGGRGPDGLPVLEVAGVASIRDSNVAVLRNGTIVARGIGRTAVDLEAGDCRTIVGVDVELPVDSAHHVADFRPFEETMTLAPGEVRAWRPSTGLTYVHLFGDSAVTASLSFGVLEANCARLRRDYRAVSCVMNTASVVALKNPHNRKEARVRLRLERVVPPKPQSPIQRRTSRDAANALCPQYFG